MKALVPLFYQRQLLTLIALALIITPLQLALPQLQATVVNAAGTVYEVNTTRDDDDGQCSAFAGPGAPATTDPDCTLREAIDAANSDGGPSEIRFRLATNDPGRQNPNSSIFSDGDEYWSIKLDTISGSLPAIIENDTTIDGTTQTNTNVFGPEIEINGNAVPVAESFGIDITTSGNTIKGLIINGFLGDVAVGLGVGIRISSSSATSNTIVGNYIGVNYSSTQSVPNSGAGILIRNGASNNQIGGLSSADRNVVSGNGLNGILLTGAVNNTIVNNLVGLDNFFNPQPNQGNGIALTEGATNNQIGGIGNLRNIISGNTTNGILINNATSTGNRIQGNYIGTNNDATAAIGNTLSGIQIGLGARNNVIGGAGQLGNIISGNNGPGIRISGTSGSGNASNNNQVLGNIIGLNSAATVTIPNRGNGIELINNVNGTIIGSATERNLIAGNTGYGVAISSSITTALTNTQLFNTWLGLNATATSPLSNSLGGIFVGNNVRQLQIGGDAPGQGLLIAGNAGPGIVISSTNATAISVLGTQIDNTGGQPNSGGAVVVTGTLTDLLFRNTTVAAHAGPAISLNASINNLSVISSTLVLNGGGLSTNGTIVTATLSNNNIYSNNGPAITLAGTVSNPIINNNSIYNNLGNAITLGGGVSGAIVRDNLIGTLPDPNLPGGLLSRGNLGSGVSVAGGSSFQAINNTIAFNTAGGIVVNSAQLPTIQSNTIVSNTNIGIQLIGSSGAIVGQNTIQANTGTGISLVNSSSGAQVLTNTVERNGGAITVDGPTSILNTIQGNVTRLNGGTGSISLLNNANQGVQPPVINFTFIGIEPVVVGNVNNAGGCGGISCTVELYQPFVSPQGIVDDEAFTLIQRIAVPPTGVFTAPLSTIPAALLASTTTSTGNSSEFASFTIRYGLAFAPSNVGAAPVFPGDRVTYTHILTNTGNVSDTYTIVATSSLGWAATITPTIVALAPGQATQVLVTLSVPTAGQNGSAANVTDITTVRASQALTTTTSLTVTNRTLVGTAPRFSLSEGTSQQVRAGQSARFTPRITNIGNVAGTVQLTATTNLGWRTTLNQSSISLNPGQSVDLQLDVTPPAGAIAPVTATTSLVATTLVSPSQTLNNVNTTTLLTTVAAFFNPDQIEEIGSAGSTKTYRHTIFYGGNGPATLAVRVRSDSPTFTATVESATVNRPLDSAGNVTFRGPDDSIEILVRVLIPSDARNGVEQRTTIELVGENSTIIDTAQDTTRISQGVPLPSRYLPIIIR